MVGDIKTVRFSLFRYQLVPIDRFFQADMISGISSIDELIARKNALLDDVLSKIKDFRDGRHETVTRPLFSKGGFYIYKVATNRSINRERKDFTAEKLDNWPSVLVAIWNEPEKQLIAVQRRTTAFQHGDTVVRLIASAIETGLATYGLRLFYEPLFESRVFWEIVKKHTGKVQALEFEFITPNMANISGTLPEELKAFAKNTNSVRNKLSIESDPESALHVEQNDAVMDGLVQYSSEGGGNVAVKIAGAKKKIHTSKTSKEIEISEMHLQGSAENIAAVLRELMK
jgi:hypothetical protein